MLFLQKTIPLFRSLSFWLCLSALSGASGRDIPLPLEVKKEGEWKWDLTLRGAANADSRQKEDESAVTTLVFERKLPPFFMPNRAYPQVVVGKGPKGENALALETDGPGAMGIIRNVGLDRRAWGEGRSFRAYIFLPEGVASSAVVQLAVRHDVWGWFSAVPTRILTPGKWTLVHWSLVGDSRDWLAMDGSIRWNDTIRYGLGEVGLRFFSKDNMQVGDDDPDVAKQVLYYLVSDMAIEDAGGALPALEVTAVRESAKGAVGGEALCGKRFELDFDLSRWYENPYDPDDVRVDVEFTLPSGPLVAPFKNRFVSMPAFYYQEFSRRALSDGAEACKPRGLASWKARFTPVSPGEHAYVIRVSDKNGDSFQTAPRTFQVAAPAEGSKAFHGFVRVDPKDPLYLSFTDDSFYYPVGLIVRSPSDDRMQYVYDFELKDDDLGTFAYDDYFTSMSESGLNFARVWMSAWWTALEWSHGYRKDYPGLGRYNQLNAWRMDHVVNLAEEKGIYLDVTLHNHGQFRASSFDQEWFDNPYYQGQGGPVDRPEEFWTNPKAREYMEKRLRYIVARWGSSPAIAWWELCNEVDLVSAYDSEKISSWHRYMARVFERIDPYRHPVTAHYTSGMLDPNVMGMPEMAVAQSTAYRADMVERLGDLLADHQVFGKPVFINEFGVGNSHEELQHNLHSGLWVSSVTPFCGAALFWWWPYVQEMDQYFQYESLLRFHKGEDYRGRHFQVTQAEVTRIGDGSLGDSSPAAPPIPMVIGMQNYREARLWVYDPRLYRSPGKRNSIIPLVRPVAASKITLDGLKAGRYRVEIWDTWKGEVIQERLADHEGERMMFIAPAFERDIAIKIGLVEEGRQVARE